MSFSLSPVLGGVARKAIPLSFISRFVPMLWAAAHQESAGRAGAIRPHFSPQNAVVCPSGVLDGRDVQLPSVALSGTGRLDLLVRRRGVVPAGEQRLVAAVRLTAGGLLGEQELRGSRWGAGGDPLAPAAVHRLLVGGEGDRKSVHHQVQLVWGAPAAARRTWRFISAKKKPKNVTFSLKLLRLPARLTGIEAGLDHQTGSGCEQEDGHAHRGGGHAGHGVNRRVLRPQWGTFTKAEKQSLTAGEQTMDPVTMETASVTVQKHSINKYSNSRTVFSKNPDRTGLILLFSTVWAAEGLRPPEHADRRREKQQKPLEFMNERVEGQVLCFFCFFFVF